MEDDTASTLYYNSSISKASSSCSINNREKMPVIPPPPSSPDTFSSFFSTPWNYANKYVEKADMVTVDGKLNQLQREVLDLNNEVGRLREEVKYQRREHEKLRNILHQCFLNIDAHSFLITNYVKEALPRLIGTNHQNIIKIEKKYKIQIVIPPRYMQPTEPIRIYLRNRNGDFLSLIDGINYILQVLNCKGSVNVKN